MFSCCCISCVDASRYSFHVTFSFYFIIRDYQKKLMRSVNKWVGMFLNEWAGNFEFFLTVSSCLIIQEKLRLLSSVSDTISQNSFSLIFGFRHSYLIIRQEECTDPGCPLNSYLRVKKHLLNLIMHKCLMV